MFVSFYDLIAFNEGVVMCICKFKRGVVGGSVFLPLKIFFERVISGVF